jgi:hypothetical protein
MSKNVISMLGAAVVGVVLVGSATQGCGGSSGGAGDLPSLCNQGCTQEIKCGAPLSMSDCVTSCEKEASCSNVDAIVAAGQKCLGITDCTALATCGSNIPDCVSSGSAGASGGGTAGSSGNGTAGTSGGGTAGASGGGTAGASGGGTAGASGGGTAGSSGTPGGTTCDTACAKADACANAIAVLIHADAGAGSLKALCDSQSAADQVSTVAGCNMILSSAATMAGAALPAACK